MNAVDITGFSIGFAATCCAKKEQDAFVSEFDLAATRPVDAPNDF